MWVGSTKDYAMKFDVEETSDYLVLSLLFLLIVPEIDLSQGQFHKAVCIT